MIPKTCNACRQTGTDKLVSLYWAWNNADGARRAHLQKLCTACFRAQVAPLIIRALEPLIACPACGISTVDDYDAVYVTYCVPGYPKDQSEMPCCGACAVEVRNKALAGAVPLPDRSGTGGGLGLSPHPGDARSLWDELGLAPERRNG